MEVESLDSTCVCLSVWTCLGDQRRPSRIATDCYRCIYASDYASVSRRSPPLPSPSPSPPFSADPLHGSPSPPTPPSLPSPSQRSPPQRSLHAYPLRFPFRRKTLCTYRIFAFRKRLARACGSEGPPEVPATGTKTEFPLTQNRNPAGIWCSYTHYAYYLNIAIIYNIEIETIMQPERMLQSIKNVNERT